MSSPRRRVDGIVVESLVELRVNKLTCILSRSERRDLVDLLFLDRAGYPSERDLQLALRKDAGPDPGVLAWLLGEFPVEPLPVMLTPLDASALRRFRDDLRERFGRLAIPPSASSRTFSIGRSMFRRVVHRRSSAGPQRNRLQPRPYQ